MSLMLYVRVTAESQNASIIKNIWFPSESNNPSFATAYIREVSSTKNMYMVCIRLKQSAIFNGIYGKKDFNVNGK
jgi:hypothetical protein